MPHKNLLGAVASSNKLSQESGKMYFDPKISYTSYLKAFKEEFEYNWNQAVSSPETSLEGFKQLTCLGVGSFGRVVMVKHILTGRIFAVKIVQKENLVRLNQVEHIHNEKHVLQSINFPFLMTLQWSRKDRAALYLGLPLVNGGELYTYLRKMKRFSEMTGRFYAAQVYLALQYLHYMQVVYRDLKPENILLTPTGYIKITDFGFAKRLDKRTTTLCGTPEYLPPEIIRTTPYDTSADWWSYGILLYEFMSGKTPFADYSADLPKMYDKIVNGEYKIPDYFSAALNDLVQNLIQVDRSKRYGCTIQYGSSDIKLHEWFKTVEWVKILNQQVSPPYVPCIKNIEDVSNFEKVVGSQIITTDGENSFSDIFANF